MTKKLGYVYIMSNGSLTLYTGVTSTLIKRVWEHKQDRGSIFTAKYKIHKLVYYEVYESMLQAIVREKQIKDMNREAKLMMILKFNRRLEDLYNSIITI